MAVTQVSSQNGTSQWFDSGVSWGTLFGGASAVTVEMWVYLTAASAGNIAPLGTTNTPTQFNVSITPAGEILFVGPGTFVSSSGFAMPINTWTHIAVTESVGGGSTLFYKNGTLQTTAGGVTLGSLSELAEVGSDFGLGGNSVPGSMSMVRVWSLTRTQPQIVANMCSPIGPTANLTAEWTLNNTLADNSGNGNTLTAIGAAGFIPGVPVPFCATATGTLLRAHIL